MHKTLLLHVRKTNPRPFVAMAILIVMILLGRHKMSNQSHFLLIDALAIAYIGFDVTYTLKTGRARLRWSGTATREHQPKKFWRYVHASYFAMAFFAAAFVWGIFSFSSASP